MTSLICLTVKALPSHVIPLPVWRGRSKVETAINACLDFVQSGIESLAIELQMVHTFRGMNRHQKCVCERGYIFNMQDSSGIGRIISV